MCCWCCCYYCYCCCCGCCFFSNHLSRKCHSCYAPTSIPAHNATTKQPNTYPKHPGVAAPPVKVAQRVHGTPRPLDWNADFTLMPNAFFGLARFLLSWGCDNSDVASILRFAILRTHQSQNLLVQIGIASFEPWNPGVRVMQRFIEFLC